MKSNQKGFSAVELLLILVFIGVIGSVGWYVWQSKNNSTSQITSNTNTDEKPKDPYEGWRTYESKLSGITFRYPSDWEFTPPVDVFKNDNGGESLFASLYSTEPKREPGGTGEPNPTTNTYMCVIFSEYGGPWQHSDWNLGNPTNTEEFKVNNSTSLTLATYKNEKPMLGNLILLDNGAEKIKTRNGYSVIVEASFNCVQGDYEAVEKMTQDFSEREETEIAKLIIKSIRY